MKLSDTFQKAKEVILTQGWTRGDLTRRETVMWDEDAERYVRTPNQSEVCLLGAVGIAKGLENLELIYESEEDRFLKKLIVKKEPEYDNRYSSYAWNDKSERTEQEVLDFLDEATIAAKEQGL